VSPQLDVPALQGVLVRLEPLSESHAADLAVAAEEDRSAYEFTFVPRAPEVKDYINGHLRRAEAGQMVPFAQVRESDGRAVGCTAYWDPRTWPERLELSAIMIGWTWLAVSAQRTGINTEAKLLLFTYAFERLAVTRVDISTDARNDRSRQAITGLGAEFEGILRSWSRSHAPGEEGLLRDSAMFSVVASEWPAVKASLRSRLQVAEPAASANRP
jgi:RimJ/RimL family protein N-acetyltransferase